MHHHQQQQQQQQHQQLRGMVMHPQQPYMRGTVGRAHRYPTRATEENHGSGDQVFLQQINEVLGPLPPNAEDPMEPFLEEKEDQS